MSVTDPLTKAMPTFTERREAGKARRAVLRRVDQGLWEPSPRRPEPVAALLAANRNRQKDLLPIKWARMMASPFAFFRGAAPLMAADLAPYPTTGLRVHICGDAHVVNLGAYAGPDGRLVFDLNDFDEATPGPWEWDVKRLAASIVLAGQEAEQGKGDCAAAVRAFVESYRNSMDQFSKMKVVELAKWQVRKHTKDGPIGSVLSQAERATPDVTLKKLTVARGRGTRHFHDKPPLLRHLPRSTAETVVRSLMSYREALSVERQQVLDAYRVVDVAFKVVGTGSVGTRDYIVLLLGSRADDSLFLQIKEELPSCYVPYLRQAPPFPHQGRRVAEGQRRLQTATDPFVGWTSIGSGDYLVRQLADHKARIEPAELKGTNLADYALVCGEVLAKAHARTGDAAAIAGYCGNSRKLDGAIAKFAQVYAEQARHDHEALCKAIKAGLLKTARL